jgi:hypothetical protein
VGVVNIDAIADGIYRLNSCRLSLCGVAKLPDENLGFTCEGASMNKFKLSRFSSGLRSSD